MTTLADWILTQPGKNPREYQTAMVLGLDSALDNGLIPVGVLPTGGGKSFVSRAVLRRARKALGIVHTNTLFDQMRETVPNATPATIQSLVHPGAAGEARRNELATFDYVWIDEAHHIVSDEWRQVLPFLKHAKLFGVTATPERADGTPLGDVFNKLVSTAKYSELVRGGFLCPCDRASPGLSRKEQRKQKKRPDGVQAYLDNARRTDGTWRPGIYFNTTKDKCRDAVERFNRAGVRAALVCDETSTDERRFIFDAYSRGELDMLCSPQALAEGFDSIRAEVCVLCRSAAHVGGYLQMCGRVLRPYTAEHVRQAIEHWRALGFELDAAALVAKERALLIDCSDAHSLHGMPTDDRDYSLEGKGITRSVEQPLNPDEDEESSGSERGDGYSEVAMKFTLVRDKLRDIFQDLTDQGKSRNYKDGWRFFQFTNKTTIAPPRSFEAKYASTCKHCRHKVRPRKGDVAGEQIFWMPPVGNGPQGKAHVYHHDCWFESLTDAQLMAADRVQPPAQRILHGLTEREAAQ